MTLEKPASKLGTYELLKEQPGIGVGSLWIARTSGDAAEAPKLFSVLRVHKHLTKKPEIVDAFLADTKAAIAFRHPNAVALLEAGNAVTMGTTPPNPGGELYLAYEHHDGETLAALVAAAGAQGLPQPVVLRIVLDVLGALGAAHAYDPALHHGELGPQHVLVGEDGVARLAGLATARVLSRLGAPVGVKNQERLSYAAPERVKSLASPAATAPPLAPAADLFSMGVLLWEGLAKQRLFTSKIDAAIVQKVLTGPIANLGSIAGVSVPGPLDEAVKKALDRDPAKRTQAAGEAAAAIEGLAIASPGEVAAEVEKLAGKTLAARKAEVRTEIGRRASGKGASTIPPPAAPKPGALPARKATLLGIVSPVAKPAAGLKDPPAPAAKEATAPPAKEVAAKETPAPAAGEAAAKEAPVAPKLALPPPPPLDAPEPSSPKAPPVRLAPRPPAESMNLEEIEVSSAPAPPPPVAPRRPPPPKRQQTLLMGSEAVPLDPKETDREKKTVSPPKPPAPPAAAKPAPAQAAATETAKPSKAASEAPAAETAAPETAAAKTAPTPSSDGVSPRSKGGAAVEKVGPGSTLGRYEILMPVARGGMASVWAAKLPGSRGFQKIFAIKTMLPDVSDDPEFESMFLDEARVAARIRHPNVVEIIDLGEAQAVLYIVMEWVEGENLGALVKAARSLGGVPMPIILRLASQVCAGLHAAHELRDDDGNLLDLVHRDISPANVLVSTSGFVKIVDFGIAKSKGRLHVTRVGGTVKGKTPYLSPEQLGQLPIDRRSDIFSFGVLLYVLATGLHPFRGETDTKTIENIALRDAVPPTAINAGIPAEFETIVLKALAKEPEDRFATAGEMQRALDQATATLGYSTTEEDVAAFVRKALGEPLAKRAQELRAAVERAEGEASKPSTAVVAPNPAAAADLAAPVTMGNPERVPHTPPGPGKAPEKSSSKPAAGAEPADVKAPPEEEVSFDGVAQLPKPKHPNAETLPEIWDEVRASADSLGAGFATPPPGEDASRPASSSDADNASLEVEGFPRRRKPVALIVGAVIGLCAIIGLVALLSGGKPETDGTPASKGGVRTGTTENVASPPPPTPPPQATTAAPTAPPTPEPPATTQAATPEPPPPATDAPASPPNVPVKGGRGPGRTTTTTKSTKKTKSTYNPAAP